MTTPGKPAFGGTVLRIPAIQSPNYVPGVSGWAIFQNGTVEFNSGTFRGTVTAGTFKGTDFIIDPTGAFFYNGVPALGNIPVAVLGVVAVDPFGNDVTPGDASALGSIIAIGAAPSGGTPTYVQLVPGSPQAFLGIGSGDPAEATPGRILATILGSGGTRALQTSLNAPRVTGQAAGAAAQILLESESPDLSTPPDMILSASDATHFTSMSITPVQVLVNVNATGNITFEANAAGIALFLDPVNQQVVCGWPLVAATTLGGGTPEPWNTLGTLAGYTVGQARYRRTALGEVEFDINVTGTGANAASVAFSVTLPAGPPTYRPAVLGKTYPLATNLTIAAMTTPPRLGITTAGVVTIAGTANIAAGINYVGGATMPLN